LVNNFFTGVVVLEVSTRRARTRHDRAALLAESLLFARLNLQPSQPVVPAARAVRRDAPGRPNRSGRRARVPAQAPAARPEAVVMPGTDRAR
jgi:hypothetical protein